MAVVCCGQWEVHIAAEAQNEAGTLISVVLLGVMLCCMINV